jgi:surfactin synthase thioesterase subunit
MKVNLICFPFAGGSAYSYGSYQKFAPNHIKLTTLEPPGRGRRMAEPLLPDIYAIADDLFKIVKPMLQEPYAFYGHSMGTIVAYLITRRIVREGLPQPLHIFVSGRMGPAAKDDEPHIHHLPQEEFRKKLKEIGGSPDELLDDNRLLDFFEPILRSDFRSNELYEYEEPAQPLDIPITLMVGKQEKITAGEALTWQKETTKPLDVHWFEGAHFFILEHGQEIMRIIAGKVKS